MKKLFLITLLSIAPTLICYNGQDEGVRHTTTTGTIKDCAPSHRAALLLISCKQSCVRDPKFSETKIEIDIASDAGFGFFGND